MSGSTERGWRIVRTADGSPTALHPVHGQAAHDLEGARSEARASRPSGSRSTVACAPWPGASRPTATPGSRPPGDRCGRRWRAPPEPFDAVFLDGFAPAVEPGLWGARFLADLAARLAPDGRIATYTASARVRAGLLAAGLELALPPHTGRQGAGTVAGRRLAADPLLRPLEPRQAAKLARRAGRVRAAPAAGKRAVAEGDSTIIPTASCVPWKAGSTGLVRRPIEA